MSIQYTKLVRDKIPDILDSKNILYKKYIADDNEYSERLVEKLFEEIEEFKNDLNVEELADILEVIEALKKTEKYKELENIKEIKKQEKGGFEKKIILTSIK